jgi:hypothetical protein
MYKGRRNLGRKLHTSEKLCMRVVDIFLCLGKLDHDLAGC